MENISWILVTMGVSLLLCSILSYKIESLENDVINLSKDFERKLKIQDTLHTGLQTDVNNHKARELTLDRQLLKFLEANEDLFKDDMSFQTLSDLLKREV